MRTPEEQAKKEKEKEAKREKEGAVTRTISKYVKIHQSFFTDLDGSFVAFEDERKGITNPAKFTWTAVHGKKSTYQLDFAIQPTATTLEPFEPSIYGGYPTPLGNFMGAIYPMFEAHVATDEKDSKNQLLYSGVGEAHLTHPDNKFWQADHLFLLFSWETDRHTDIGQKRLDAIWTPDWRIPGWDQDVSLHRFFPALFSEHWVFHFRPFAGIECIWIDKGFDKFRTEAKLPTAKEDFGFLHAGMSAEVRFEDRFALTSSYNYRAELYGKPGTHGYFELTASVKLDPGQHFSTGVTYTRGEDSPLFKDLNKVEAWVGVEF